LWSVNYSQVVREQVKSKKPDVFQMPKQNNPKHKYKPKTQQEGRHPEIQVKHHAFRKMKSSKRLVSLYDDIAIPASRRMSQVAHSWKEWQFCIIPVVEQEETLVHLHSGR